MEATMDVPQALLGFKEDGSGSSTKSLDVHEPQPAPLPTSSTIRGQSSDPSESENYILIYLKEDGSFHSYDPEFERGTTALAFTTEKGIILAVDHSDKSSEWPKNVFKLNSHMLATVSGGSESLLADLQEECRRQERTERKKTSVAEALKWLAETLAGYQEKPSIGILIAVWNESDRALYHMNGDGVVVKGDLLATGCGSVARIFVMRDYIPYSRPQAYDLRSRNSCRRKRNISVKEAAELAKRAMCATAFSSPVCGDTVSVYHLGSGGCEKCIEADIEEWQKENMKCPRMRYKIIGKGWSE